MLVLSRKPGEKILIGDNVSITIVRIGPNTVRIGIEAPRNMNIIREELQPPAGEIDDESHETLLEEMADQESVEEQVANHRNGTQPTRRKT